MDTEKFARIAESLRQYRRAELKEFDEDLGGNAVDQLYVDPLPNDAVLKTVKSSNTTFLLGRKGTGKSTIFAKAQSDFRRSQDIVSCYLDVKSLYDLCKPADLSADTPSEIDLGISRTHLLRKAFIGTVTAEVISELRKAIDEMSIWDRWLGKRQSFEELVTKLRDLETRLKDAPLTSQELPVLQKIQNRWKNQQLSQRETGGEAHIKGKASPIDVSAEGQASASDFEKTLDDSEVYKEYSTVVLKAFPFDEIISEIQALLDESKLKRLVIFFDDFSELSYLDQRLFVDVVLSPLNNASNEAIKLKVAGYPGRVYYGSIDPTKIDTLSLDFSDLYEATEVQSMEASAIDYTKRLLTTRFKAFGANINEYFDSGASLDSHLRLLFQATFNVPRLMGSLLHTCYLDRVAKSLPVTGAAIRLASRKYYESAINQYFEVLNRFALEPFDNKLDRHNQKKLLNFVLKELRELRKKITEGSVGGSYFSDLSAPPVTHFHVNSSLCDVFNALEANFLLSRYKDTRDKDGNPVTVLALYYGLSELERFSWGYPEGRQYRNYFVQRCFDLSAPIHDFLSSNQTIRCDNCKATFPLEQKESLELYQWRCPKCLDEKCAVVNIAEDFTEEVKAAEEAIRLEPVELEILSTLHNEHRAMAAGEVSSMIDVTYQLVGRRTSKLQDKGLVKKSGGSGSDRRVKSTLLELAERTYFSGANDD